jgi:thiol-disulfide isomerase/thioredoxin
MGRSARFIAVLGPALALAVFALAGWSLLSAENGSGPPPLTGWMQNFVYAPSPTKGSAAQFIDQDGTSYTLEDFRGKVVLVNFWATWCGPCIRELPSLVRLHTALAGENFTVLALSQDRNGWAVITPFLAKQGFGDLPFFHDRRLAFSRDAKVLALPSTVLYGRDGATIGRLTGHAEWDSDEAIAVLRHVIAR